MIQVCKYPHHGNQRLILGEIEPLEDRRHTDIMCDICAKAEMRKAKNIPKVRRVSNTIGGTD